MPVVLVAYANAIVGTGKLALGGKFAPLRRGKRCRRCYATRTDIDIDGSVEA